MELQHSDELFKLCDDLVFLYDEFTYLAERISPFGHYVDFLNSPPEPLVALVKQISRSRERVEQTLQTLNSPRILEVVAQIHRELTRQYIAQGSNAPLVVSRCLFRVVSHFDEIVSEADRVLRLLPAVEEQPAAQRSADISSNKSLSKCDSEQTSIGLCSLMNIVIFSEGVNSDHLTFQDELRLYNDAIDMLKDYAAQKDLSGPISKVVFKTNGDDEIAQTLSGKQKKIYKILKRREGAGAYLSTLLKEVWGVPSETEEAVDSKSILKHFYRLNNDKLIKFGYEIECPPAEGEGGDEREWDRKAFLRKIEASK